MIRIWSDTNIPFARNWLLQLMIVLYVLFWGVLAISPTDRIQWSMENILVVLLCAALAFTYKKFRFRNASYLLIGLFLCLHTYAAHYTYQNTPFDVWLKTWLPVQRSYFDRVVHFAFGLIMTFPLRELIVRTSRLSGFWSYFVPAGLIFSASALFEIVEMGAALVAGQSGQQYVGLQGDMFDSQKDMGLGLTGAVVSMGGLARVRKK